MGFPSKEALERFKLTLDVVTPFVVIVIVLLVAANLTWVTASLVKKLEGAGFHITKVQAFGVEAELEQAQTKVQATEATLVAQNQVVAKAKQALDCGPTNCTAAQIDNAKAQLSILSQGVDNALAQTRSVAAQLDQANAPATASDWVAVISADTNQPEAAFEADRAKKHGFSGLIETVRRGKWLRTVIHFGSATDANNALAGIQAMTGRTPYLRDFSAWCPTPTKETDGLRVCGQSGSD
jgi:hypothetical protein